MGHLSLPHLEVVTRACPESHHFVIKTAKLPLLSSPNKISKPNRGFPNHQHQHWYIKTKRWQWMPLGFIMSYLHELSRGPKLISTPTPIPRGRASVLMVSAFPQGEKLYNLKPSINLSVKRHRTQRSFHYSEKMNLTLTVGLLLVSREPILLSRQCVLLCLRNSYCLKLYYVSWFNFFLQGDKNWGVAVLPVT